MDQGVVLEDVVDGEWKEKEVSFVGGGGKEWAVCEVEFENVFTEVVS